MPGVNPPVNEKFFSQLADMQRNIAALATQQQRTFTNLDGAPLINLGLVPGSNPARYGMQIVDPATGAELIFIGQGTSSKGELVMESESGTVVMFVGTTTIPDGSGRLQQSVLLYRDDGTEALGLTDAGSSPGHTHQQALQWFDRSGNVVLADDTVSGTGVARPHIPTYTLGNTNITTWPQTNATSSTAIAAGAVEYQHPNLTWIINCYAPAGVSAQFSLVYGSATIGTFSMSGGGSGQFQFWEATEPVPAGLTFGQVYNLTLNAHVTAGSGTVYAQPYVIQGIGS